MNSEQVVNVVIVMVEIVRRESFTSYTMMNIIQFQFYNHKMSSI